MRRSRLTAPHCGPHYAAVHACMLQSTTLPPAPSVTRHVYCSDRDTSRGARHASFGDSARDLSGTIHIDGFANQIHFE